MFVKENPDRDKKRKKRKGFVKKVKKTENCHSKRLKSFQCPYETFFNKSKENNTDTAFKKVVALERTIALLKQKSKIRKF